MEILVQFIVQAVVNLNRMLLNLNRQSSSRFRPFSQISELNAKFDSQFTKSMLEPDWTGLRHHYRAQGNVFNFADVTDVLKQEQGPSHGVAPRGRVYVYSSPLNPTSLDPERMKPMATIKVTTSQTIALVLQQVSCCFSPVCSKYTTLYVEILFWVFVWSLQ